MQLCGRHSAPVLAPVPINASKAASKAGVCNSHSCAFHVLHVTFQGTPWQRFAAYCLLANVNKNPTSSTNATGKNKNNEHPIPKPILSTPSTCSLTPQKGIPGPKKCVKTTRDRSLWSSGFSRCRSLARRQGSETWGSVR